MWTDPEKEERPEVLGVLVCRKWGQAKGWMQISSVEQGQGAWMQVIEDPAYSVPQKQDDLRGFAGQPGGLSHREVGAGAAPILSQTSPPPSW
jgi:hypothetical protein